MPVPLRDLPPQIGALRDLALDLRWTWSRHADALWREIDPDLWAETRNPWTVLRNVAPARWRELADDPAFSAALTRVAADRLDYLAGPRWFDSSPYAGRVAGIAYFSMEFGLTDALPLYAGGLGILAGDILKTASDLGVPLVGVGLLFQEGYFRQTIGADGRQHEAYPYNDPTTMPIEAVRGEAGERLCIALDLPGRLLRLRVWQAHVGRTRLYLLDSNDPQNREEDRAITAKLYGGGSETRLMQEIVLGFGGWRLLEALHPWIEICHINEGHAAFVAVERARRLAGRYGLRFDEALWAARAGNVFTTHTSVPAAFDVFPAPMVARHLRALMTDGAADVVAEIMALGRIPSHGDSFSMPHLAVRACRSSVGVSELHGRVSRHLFRPLFPAHPDVEIPIGHVTNGVHMPSWHSAGADRVWAEACGEERWRGMPDGLCDSFGPVRDEVLWSMRSAGRHSLVRHVRARLKLRPNALGDESPLPAHDVVLDPNILTLGFARRFTAYKRSNLLLRDPNRLRRLLTDSERPVQIVVAGKAHPDDQHGKHMIRQWVTFARRPEICRRVVFLEDYDITLAQELVEGVDVWVNTPRRPLEASGTSGMKVLVNGGLNLSTLDGWWQEAYAPDMGWAIGSEAAAHPDAQDAADAEHLYSLLERDVVPEFYDRDDSGLPRRWIARLRRSMAVLAPRFSGARMMRDYLTQTYVPAADALRRRAASQAAAARDMAAWARRVAARWAGLRIGPPAVDLKGNGLAFAVSVVLADMDPADIRVEVYAEPLDGEAPEVAELARRDAVPGAASSYVYAGEVTSSRPADHFTVRIRPWHPDVGVPAEMPLILWQR